MHQGAVRVPVRPEPDAQAPGRISRCLRSRASSWRPGARRRFGRDKLAEPYRGMPMLQHAVLRLGEVCSEVIVVLAADAPAADADRRPPGRARPDRGRGSARRGPRGLLAVGTERAGHRRRRHADLQTRVLLEMLQVAGEAGGSGGAPGRRSVPAAAERRPNREGGRVAHALLHDGYRALEICSTRCGSP